MSVPTGNKGVPTGNDFNQIGVSPLVTYFNSFNAFSVIFSLSKNFTKAIIKNVNAKVIKYTIILIFQFPLEKYCPTIVDDIIDGNLQNVAIIINLNGFIGNNAPK